MEEFFIVPTAWYYVHSPGQLTKFFLVLILSSYCIGAVVSGPLTGSIADRSEDPRFLFICCCALIVIAHVVYSVNISAYFPLVGRFISGLANGGIIAILLGQVVLQVIGKSRSKNFVFLKGMYFLGSAVGAVIYRKFCFVSCEYIWLESERRQFTRNRAGSNMAYICNLYIFHTF